MEKKIVLLLLIAVIISIFSGIATAKSTITGKLYDKDGKPYNSKSVTIERSSDGNKWDGKSDDKGEYSADSDGLPDDNKDYKLIIKDDTNKEELKENIEIPKNKWNDDKYPSCEYNRSPPPGIPEFPNAALPIASVLGLVFLFQNRKKNGV